MTADAAEIVRLAERVEQATGPDRELDYEIHERLHGEWLRKNAYIHEPGDDGWYSATPLVKGAHSISPPQSYTASLDAAMGLVPEGAGFNLDRYWIREGVRWKVEIATGGIPEQPRQVFDCWDAYTAPLATVAAALRARAAQHDHEVG